MTVLTEDPLISAMAIREELPLHESARRLRAFYPECPRVYGVAVMGDVSRRRWWPLAEALTDGRLAQMYADAAAEIDNPTAAAQQLAASLAHAVIGRVVALVVSEGRAWDAGLENLWVHVDSDGAIDWLGVVDPTVRVLPDDPDTGRAGAVELPSEPALATWIAHRCHRTLEPLFAELCRVSGAAVSVPAMWRIVGTAVVVAATQVPLLAGVSENAGMRRGQCVLDALVGFGLPVRGRAPMKVALAS
ncbi:iron reductase [Mycolicibacterium brumae]|uniref:Iron reductase n=1 Tax=Mycolicibacterium brumae TaxID=85968 RepID=A0A2G5PDU4_9MYCO|nr:iron reductase [Mycolicibacterium brumae]MCV7192846.1 iron reductase [Mycolicibacterium brumae]PIB76486.1 iron reductase [Mycolicibacterium brumae]RWA23436.1 hypothetical protein MBRU_01040 [Mycolicibacterium brumae DSM 44177]UWW08634.1 iron reductase [Mycolicibacterium brumae]